MKLAILGPYPDKVDVKDIRGGVEAVVVNMVKGLSRFKDLEINIITASHDVDREMNFSINGINVHVVPADKRLGNIRLYSNTRSMIRKKLNEIKPDLVHSHSLGYYTLAALDNKQKRLVVSTHGFADINYGLKANIMGIFSSYMSGKCKKGANNIIINSPYAKKYLSRFGNKNFYELNNPVSDDFFDIDRDSEEEGRLLFVGNVSRAKGATVLLKALSILKEKFSGIRLRIAGQIREDEFYSQLIGFIKEKGLGEAIQFLGQLNEAELKEEYEKASIFAFPSQQDVAPLALLQAMAAGKGIVATRVGGIPYIIDDGKNGFLIDPKDFNALADKITILMKDHELCRRFGLNAQRKINEEYRIDTITNKLYKIYREVAR